MKYPLKLIEWHDAYSGNHTWFNADQLVIEDKAHTIWTLGFEIMRTENHVILSMSCTDNGQLCDLFTIPLAMIVREQTFRVRRSLKEGIS